MENAERTKIQKLAQEALEVQNACNMGGLSRRFAEVVQEVTAELRAEAKRNESVTFSTGAVNQHPIVQLWASKIHDLAGVGLSDAMAYDEAFEAALKIVRWGYVFRPIPEIPENR